MTRPTAYHAGDRYGRLVLVSPLGRENGNMKWLCRCDCGVERKFFAAAVRHGHTSSCGCAKSELVSAGRSVHGLKGTREYRCWSAARSRCFNVNNKNYPNWGGRGITMCDAWGDFEVFLRDMGPCPPGTSIDRIDNDGNYEPGNCRWATPMTQAWNSRKPVFVELGGEAVPLCEVERRLGVGHGQISNLACRKAIAHQQAADYFIEKYA